MFPSIVLFGKTISYYQICILFGFLFLWIYFSRTFVRDKIDEPEFMFYCIGIFFSSFIFSHIVYGIVNWKIIWIFARYSKRFLFALKKIFIFGFGGSVFYGGLMGILLALYVITKITKKKYLADLFAPGIPLFHAWGRLGCFLSGCCYGVPSKLGFIYRYSIVESVNHVCRFPVQLLESFCNLVLFFILSFLFKKKMCKDRLIVLYIIMYAPIRFCLEFLRGDTYRGIYMNLSTSQWISIVMFLSSLLMFVKSKKSCCIIDDEMTDCFRKIEKD